MENRQESYSKTLLIILGLLTLLLLFLKPQGALPPVSGELKSAAAAGEESRDPVATIKVGIVKKAKAVVAQKPQQPPAAGDFTMPYIEGHPQAPKAYLQLVLNRGGLLLLTRGAKFLPVGQILMDGESCRIEKLPPDFLLPGLMARDVTKHVRPLFEQELPRGATRVLLLWPDTMQENLHQQLQRLPSLGSQLKVAYEVVGRQLHLHLKALDKGGNWYAIDHTIVL